MTPGGWGLEWGGGGHLGSLARLEAKLQCPEEQRASELYKIVP